MKPHPSPRVPDRSGEFELVVSSLVLDELERAPEPVRAYFADLKASLSYVDVDTAAYELQQAYLDAHVVGARWATDALHVVAATMAGCGIIASWNFKHIVNFRRISLYNGVNQRQGYGSIAIHTPPEVVFDDDEEEGF